MPAPAGLRFRAAGPGDANAIAGLHADSWQRHYRGAFSDAFLDNDVAGYLLPLWTERLARPDSRARTILAEIGGAVVGVAHTLLGEHPRGAAGRRPRCRARWPCRCRPGTAGPGLPRCACRG